MTRKHAFLLVRLALAALALSLVFLIGHQVKGSDVRTDSALTRFDHAVSADMASFRESVPVLQVFFFGLTLLAALQTMLVLVPLLALLLWSRGLHNAALVLLLCGIVSGVSNSTLKHHFERPRPDKTLRDRWVWENNESYPSGHSSSSLALFGLLGFAACRQTRKPCQHWGIALGFGVLILAIGFSRIFLCAHFFSDVMGGYLLGAVWLLLSISMLNGCNNLRDCASIT